MEPISRNKLSMLDCAAPVAQLKCRAGDLETNGGVGWYRRANLQPIRWLQRSSAHFGDKTSAVLLAALPQFEGNPTLQSLILISMLLTSGSALHFLKSSIHHIRRRLLRGLGALVNSALSNDLHVRPIETQTS